MKALLAFLALSGVAWGTAAVVVERPASTTAEGLEEASGEETEGVAAVVVFGGEERWGWVAPC
jgi:hypothetical protein